MTDDRTLSLSTVSATINAPIEKVDIADWLFHLPDAEYQRCSHAHIAAGTTTTDDGRPMSINVETIGEALVVQHYVGEVCRPHYCRMVSISDSISPAGLKKLRLSGNLVSGRSTIRPASSGTTFIRALSIRLSPSSDERGIPSSRRARLDSRLHTLTTRKRRRSSQRASSGERLAFQQAQPMEKNNESVIYHQQLRNCVLAVGSYASLLAPH